MDTDILISGGGIAGMIAAAAFGSAGFTVVCVDPASGKAAADERSTAFLQPARDVLRRAGLWDTLLPHAAPLQVMRIIDAGGPEGEARQNASFDASEISDQPFGWNFPNRLLRDVLPQRLAEMANVSFLQNITTTALNTRETEARVTLSDGQRIRAKLVIAADGRDSPMRRAAGIAVRTTRFGQKALSFSVSHTIPHDNISTELHRSGGPFTLVPLPDRDGTPASAVVWMERGPEAERLRALPREAFEDAINERSCGVLGQLRLITEIGIFPIIAQRAERMAGQRIALMAEAAHVLPPIGAQGLNTSLADLAALLDLAIARPEGLGDATMLTAYHTARHNDIRLRSLGIEMLNRASMMAPAPLRDLRSAMLGLLHGAPPVRRALMRAGLGAR
ncbi:UbiH/UbiF family hydroxylase [Falsirhodobacter sp. alg1]|uniref:UbiH/UbiF family hydroxylase n=1 Tax=Falsirhodobacter sp. alg1 TaxID=1472418 RepID=UPI0005EEDDE5|nr:UbiH/UbiF family hydroxylase [Falsirhodobacter sp. alg1]